MNRFLLNARQYYYLLIYLPLRIFSNQFSSATLDTYLKNFVLASFGLGVAVVEYIFFTRIWELADQIPMSYFLLLPRLISLTCSLFFAFLSYSSLFTALSSLYHSNDLHILLRAPLPVASILFQKGIGIGIRSGSTLILLSLPPIISLGIHLKTGFPFYLFTFFLVFLLSLAAINFGICISMILMALFPAKRMHQTIAIIGLCIAVFMITSIRFLHLETLWGEHALQNPIFSILQQESWLPKYSPGNIFANAIYPFCLGDNSLSFWYGISFFIAVLSLCGFLFLGKFIFLKGWYRLQEKTDSVVRKNAYSILYVWDRLPLPATWLSLLRKDYLIFMRDPAVWTQVFMMVPLGFLYVLNILYLPIEQNEVRVFFAIANMGVVGLIIAAVSARYIFPAASREGKPVWVLYSCPVKPLTRILQKALFTIPPVFLLGMLLLIVSCFMLKLEITLFIKVIMVGFFFILQICVMAVFLGYCFPVYSYQHVMELSLGKGAFIFMTAALLEIGTFFFVVWHCMLSSGEISIPVWSTLFWLWAAGWLFLTYGVFLLACRKSEYL